MKSAKFKKVGGNMVQGQVFLKGGAGTFPIESFQGLSFLHLEITLFFDCHSKLSKNKPKKSHKLR